MNDSLPQQIMSRLTGGPAAAADLARTLGVHQSTLSRHLRPMERAGRVVRLLGRTKGARYGLARRIGVNGSSWPVFSIDALGTARELGTLNTLSPDHIAVEGGPPRVTGLTQGIPYFLEDARPAGFLGRAIPAAYPELDLPGRVQDWTDDHFLSFLTRRGADNVGNLIVGTESLDRHLAGTWGPPRVGFDDRSRTYPALARAAMSGVPPGSSTHGEHPKFAVILTHAAATTQVLVKFSPPRDTPLGARWADLLVAECVASTILSAHGIVAASSRMVDVGSQVFLESERFDRAGAQGRLGVASLYAVDLARYGMLDSWTAGALRLHADHLLLSRDCELIRLVDAFGQLIANTDRHFGNITLFDRYEGPFELAPIYDMLPMLFAPRDGQLIDAVFEPPGPSAASLSVWPQARELAETYWRTLCDEPRLSEDFRGLCDRCLKVVRRLRR